MVMPQQNAEAFVNQMFKVYDKDGNGLLDFQVILKYFELICLPFILQEFMLLSDSTVSASLEEKLRWAFKIYDKDMSGGYPIVKVPQISIISAQALYPWRRW